MALIPLIYLNEQVMDYDYFPHIANEETRS